MELTEKINDNPKPAGSAEGNSINSTEQNPPKIIKVPNPTLAFDASNEKTSLYFDASDEKIEKNQLAFDASDEKIEKNQLAFDASKVSTTPQTDQARQRIQDSTPTRASIPQKITPNLGPLGLNPDAFISNLSLDKVTHNDKDRKNLVTNTINSIPDLPENLRSFVHIPNTSGVNTSDLVHTLQSNVASVTDKIVNDNNHLATLSTSYQQVNEQLKKDSEAAKNLIDKSVLSSDEYKQFQLVKSKIQDANTSNALALEYYTNLKKLSDDKKAGLGDSEDYKKLQEVNAKIASINPDELNAQSKETSEKLQAKFKHQQETVLNPLKNQYANSFKILSDEWKNTYNNSFLDEIGKKYGLDASGNINASQQQIQSDYASKVNNVKYDIYKQHGLVTDLPSYLPPGVSDFIKSNTYLNATSSEKKYYLNELYSQGNIAAVNKTRAQFFNDLSGTLTPKLDLVILKAMARDNYNKYDKLARNGDTGSRWLPKKTNDYGSTIANMFLSGDSSEFTEYRAIAEKFKEIADGDYENESGILSSFLNTWDTKKAIPFVSSVMGLDNILSVKRVVDFVNKNPENYNKLSPIDKGTFDAYGMAMAYNQMASPDVYHKLGSITSSGVAFMGELAITGGISNVVAKTVSKSIANSLVNLGIKTAEWTPAVATGFGATVNLATKLFNPATLDIAANVGGKIATKAIQYNVQTGLALGADVAENTVQRLTTKNPVYFSNDANQVVNTIQETVHDNLASAVAKSWLSQFATVSTMHISGMALNPLAETFLNKAVPFTEEQFTQLSKSTGLEVETLKFVKGFMTDNKVGDLVSRLMLSDIPVMREFKALTKEIGFNPFDPATFEPGALKTFLQSARFGSFGSDVFKMFVNNRIQPIINGDKDPIENWIGDVKNIAIGLSPIFAVGGLTTLAANLGTYRIRKEANKLDAIYKQVESMPSEQWSSNDIASSIQDFRNKDAQDMVKQLIAERDRFESGDLRLVNPDMSFKEYMDAKRESLSADANAVESLKDIDTRVGAQDAINSLQSAIDSAPTEQISTNLKFRQDQIEKYFSKPVEEREGLYHEIKTTSNDFARLDHLLSDYSLDAYRFAPKFILEKINALDVPDSMKEHLLEKYKSVEQSYEEEKAKYGIKTDNDGTPVSFTIKSFNDAEITFSRNADGTNNVTGVLHTGSDSPDLSAIQTEIAGLNTEHLRALENIVSRTESLPTEFKEQVSKSALTELLKRFENLESVSEIGASDYASMIDDIQDLSTRAGLTEQQKQAIGLQIRRNIKNTIAEDDTEGGKNEMQNLLFTLYQNADILDKTNLIQIAQAVGSMNRRKSVDFERTDADTEGFNKTDVVDFDTPPVEVDLKSAKTQEQIRNIKLKRVKSFDKYVTDNPESAVARIGKKLDELVNGNEDKGKTGVITDNAANLVKGAIMSSDWLVKMLDVKNLHIDWEGSGKGTGSIYNPKTKSISIKIDKSVSESQIARELMEELTHNAHHNLLIAIDSSQGNDPRFGLTDADIEYISGQDRQDVNTIISKYYKESKYDYTDFTRIKNLAINERTPEEQSTYNNVIDYLQYMKSKFDKSEDKSLFNINFKYEYAGSKTFNTKSVIENFGRFDAFRKAGYTNEHSAYYSIHTGEFFARTMADRLLHSQLEYAESSRATKLYKSVTEFFSNAIKLPSFIRTVKSDVLNAEDLNKIVSDLSSYEKQRLEEVQGDQNKFYNRQDEANWKEVNEIGKQYYGGIAPVLKVNEYVNDGDYDKLGNLVQHLYDNTDSNKLEKWLDHTLNQVNIESGRLSLDTKGIMDYLKASDIGGEFKGTLEEYLNDNSTDILGALRSKVGDFVYSDFAEGKHEVKEFNIKDIRVLQNHEGVIDLDSDRIYEYIRGKYQHGLDFIDSRKDQVEQKENIPPSVITKDNVLIDGTHRIASLMVKGVKKINAIQLDETLEEYFNKRNGSIRDHERIENLPYATLDALPEDVKNIYQIFNEDLGAIRSTAQSIDYKTGDVVLKDGTKARIHIDDVTDMHESWGEPKMVSMIGEDGKIFGSVEFAKNEEGKWFSFMSSTQADSRRMGVSSSLYDFFTHHYSEPVPSASQQPDGKKLWEFFNQSEVNPDELGAKRTPTLNLDFFNQMMTNKKSKTSMPPEELYKALKEIEDSPNQFTNKKEQSEFANKLIQSWKQQYMRTELPSGIQSKIGEQLKLTNIPIRSKISDYVKDINFITKFTKDVDYRDAYTEAKKALSSAKNRYGANYSDSVEFYMSLRKLAKVDLSLIDNAGEMRGVTKLLKTKRDDVQLDTFKDKVNEVYDKYIDSKEPSFQSETPDTPANLEQDNSGRQLAGFLKTVPLPEIEQKDIYIKKLMDIDETNLSGKSLKNYVRHLDFVRRNGSLDKQAYDYINNHESQIRSAEVMSQLNDKFVDLMNQKINANPIADYARGLFPFSFLPDVVKRGDSLGSLSKYNVQDYLDFYDGMKDGYTGPLNKTIIEPILQNIEKVKAGVEKALGGLNPVKHGITSEDAAVAGIHSLLNQSYNLEPITDQMAANLNEHFETDEYKQGMILAIGSDGHNFAQTVINNGIAKSIANSYGEDTGIGADKAKENITLVADKRGTTIKKIEEERQYLLDKYGVASILDLANGISSGTIVPDEKITNWSNEVTNTFKDIKDGKYSDGLTLEQASMSRAGVPFKSIENYSPIIRYRSDEIPVDFDNNNGNQKYFGFSQDLNMNESFLESRKSNVLALNVNLWESAAKKIDQQLFWLNNSDHKNFLDSFFKTDLFDKSGDKNPTLALSQDATNTLKQALNVYYNRGVTEGQVALLTNKYTKQLNAVLNNIKPFYVGAIDKAPAQLSTVVGSTGAMKGNPALRMVSMTKGIADYTSAMLDDNHPLYVMLREQAKEVYYRGLSDYQIPLAENGALLSSTLLGEQDRGTYARGEETYASNLISSIKTKDFNKSVVLAPLMFFDNMAARMSFAALYNNYCQFNGMEADYSKPNQDAIRFAIQGVRKTQHSTNELLQPMITKGIVPGEGNEHLYSGAVATMLLNSLYSFKTFSINETKAINKEQFILKESLANGEYEKAGDSVQNLVALHASKAMFFLLKQMCSLPRLALVSYMYSHGDLDRYKARLSATTTGQFDWKNILLKTGIDDFASVDGVKEVVTGAVKAAYESAKGAPLTDDEALTWGAGQTREGGFLMSAILDGATKAIQAGQTYRKDGATETTIAQSAQAALNIANMFGAKIGTAEINELMREWEKQSKMNSPVVIQKFDSKSKNTPVIEQVENE